MTQALTVEEATKALDDAIARYKAAEKAASDMYGDVIAAREELNRLLLMRMKRFLSALSLSVAYEATQWSSSSATKTVSNAVTSATGEAT